MMRTAHHGPPDRATVMAGVRRLVVKVGSSLIADPDQGILENPLRALLGDLVNLPPRVTDLVIVSSGAIAAGRGKCGLGKPSTIPQKQALAALGQSRLMWAYENILSEHGRKAAQILLTLDDFRDRRRFLNARNTLFTLLAWGMVPVINENDTVAVDEIKLGDNDNLSALVTGAAEADLLVILSDVDGLHESDPRTDPSAKRVPVVRRIDAAILATAGGTGSSVGTGGMATKLAAAAKVNDLGVPVVIAAGTNPGVVGRIVAGQDIGTLFLPRQRLAGRKHWILHTQRPKGTLRIDPGGVEAIVAGGGSLLAVGIREVDGTFSAGDAVRLADRDGREFARGLVNYGSREVLLIRGRRTDEIEAVLGYKYFDEVINRDDLVLTDEPGHRAGD